MSSTEYPSGPIDSVAGRGVPVRGNDIDTDRIIPARFLRCVTFDGLGEHAFEDDRKAAGGAHSFDQPHFQGARVLVVGANFGCGSSREHAPQSLIHWGIRAIVGESFAEIFLGNCGALGVPCVCLSATDIDQLSSLIEADPAVELTVDIEASAVRAGAETFAVSIPDGTRSNFLSGQWDATQLLCADVEDVQAVADRLPYVSSF